MRLLRARPPFERAIQMTAPAFDDQLPSFQVYRAIAEALKEDLGDAGDITTKATVPEAQQIEALIVGRKPGRIAGLQFAEAAFKTFDHDAALEIEVADGADVSAGQTIARIRGNARALLTAERVALNYLGRLSGIATLTNAYVAAIEGTDCNICCTRKTTPGLRAFEKYAVRAGGGVNHRFGLYDAVLIKDNHIIAAGGLREAVEGCRARAGHMVKIEVEVDNLDQLRTLLNLSADAVLLDNMDVRKLKEAVALVDGRMITEASGGVTLESVKSIAETGVDLISVGALTHSPPALDVGLDFLQ